MNLLRARLVACALSVLACQAAAFSAAPVALCRGALSADADLDECCRKLGPGQTCPMHHTTHRGPATRGSGWTCVCSPSDAVLASIVGVAGALPEPVRVPGAPIRIAVIIPFVPSTLEHQQLPQYPPPRLSVDLRPASRG